LASISHSSSKFSLDTRPLYMRVEEALEELVNSCKAGDKLPPEAKLAQQLGVSRATLREVLRTFEERGLIVSKHGIGTFVTGSRLLIESGLEVLESVDSMADRFGYQISMRDLDIQQQAADAVISKHLDIPVGDPVYVITRTRVKEDLILAYMYDAIPASLIDPEDLKKQFTGSMLDYLRSRFTAQPFWAQTNLHSIQATTNLAKKMKVPHGTALLLLEEKLYSVDNHVINYSRNYYITSHFLFHIIRKSV
jgi:GntR family transcriptional regulator